MKAQTRFICLQKKLNIGGLNRAEKYIVSLVSAFPWVSLVR